MVLLLLLFGWVFVRVFGTGFLYVAQVGLE